MIGGIFKKSLIIIVAGGCVAIFAGRSVAYESFKSLKRVYVNVNAQVDNALTDRDGELTVESDDASISISEDLTVSQK